MSAATCDASLGDAVQVPLRDVESEISRQLKAAQGTDESPVRRARMSNLVIYCDCHDMARSVAAEVPAIVTIHPARVLLLICDREASSDSVDAHVLVRPPRIAGSQNAFSEQITLVAGSQGTSRLGFAMRSLLIGDLPTNLWWASLEPPPMGGAVLFDIGESAQQVVYDSLGWLDPANGVAATAYWLQVFERGSDQGRWRVASDLNWRRLKYWRRAIGQAIDPAGEADTITEVLVEHGPHAVIQAWELVSWMASHLGWQVQAGRLEPGVEISWQAEAPHGKLRLRIQRMAEGPSEIHRVRIACRMDGKNGALRIEPEAGRRLAVIPEGVPGSPRTMTLQPQSIADMVGRQLSDREPDVVFRESMQVAQILAQSVLG